MRKNLIICRAGDKSLHKQWLGSENRNFDLWINYYGSVANKYLDNCIVYKQSGGLKYPEVYTFISDNLSKLLHYDAICLMDDDISTDTNNLNMMFNIFHCGEFWLAQPALTADSFFSHPITVQVSDSILRITNFIEPMCPIFRKDILLYLLHTFTESKSGWGLDFLWQHLLKYPRCKNMIIDACPVKHTRAPGTGEAYRILDVSPEAEAKDIMRKYSIKWPYPLVNYGGVKKQIRVKEDQS